MASYSQVLFYSDEARTWNGYTGEGKLEKECRALEGSRTQQDLQICMFFAEYISQRFQLAFCLQTHPDAFWWEILGTERQAGPGAWEILGFKDSSLCAWVVMLLFYNPGISSADYVPKGSCCETQQKRSGVFLEPLRYGQKIGQTARNPCGLISGSHSDPSDPVLV